MRKKHDAEKYIFYKMVLFIFPFSLKTDMLVVASFHMIIIMVTIVFNNLLFTLFSCRLLDALMLLSFKS